jgi:hypothetical protein
MIAGGPAAGILIGVVLLETGALLSSDPGWLKHGLLAAGVWNIVASAVNLLPLRNGLMRSDGAWLMTLARGGPEADESIASMYWIDLVHSLTPPGNWPPEVVEAQESALSRPQPLTPNQLDLAILAGYLLYFHYADRGDWEEAHHVITKAADFPRPSKRRAYNSRFDIIDVVHAAHLALRGKNPRGARSALERIHHRSFMRRNSLYVGSLAAIALQENDPVTALELATVARNVLEPSLMFVAADRLEDSWWEEVMLRAQALLPAAGAETKNPVRAIVGGGVSREELFAWDPGVPSDLRTVWIWRGSAMADLDLSA